MTDSGRSTSVFEFRGHPPLARALPLSLQHILAMIMGTVTVPIIVAGTVGATLEEKMLLIQISLLASGVSTLLQLYGIRRFGARLPTIFGVGFAYVPTLTAVGAQYGLEGILGAQIIGGGAMILVGFFIQRIRHFFPPVVAGTVVLVIGLSLYDIAINYMAGGIGRPDFGEPRQWLVALLTLAVVLVVSQFARGFLKLSAIICGILVGYVLALAMGMVDFSPVREANWFSAPTLLPFELAFHPAAILSMVIICVINSVQTIGDLSATTVGGMDRELDRKELAGGLLGNGLCTAVGSVFGALPTASFSQNVGIVAMTKVISRTVLALAAVFILLAGLMPKFGALMTTIPYPVLGGATITVFGMITMTGIQLLIRDELSSRNITIVSLALAMSLGIYAAPDAIGGLPQMLQLVLGGSPIVVAALVSVSLNLILPRRSLDDERREREAIAEQMRDEPARHAGDAPPRREAEHPPS
ncbi:uracil-xanthine permease family protein [Halomonas elongata]|uniref:NCS2 family transport protein n=1 Tax=Halomonas elongata (strain ATCC 33173 / DSM 2581 / NBRC 15536 / NCIMB 2198 / 1H9) TaxID=768066 RepID=E1VBJ9_HALED|nr:nucleobase:cation symporter-2 family protein [Halomonas elongata]WBF17921.1 purine permease [Halomonas elongata]WPU46768.1 nucleobase:cation symporter-2 family protein [Halomonas elongata DSM 2581]CBV44156.1 NCS2 family transport protein [Halomonas elongata DSM 2581]